jgi:hypothetical protein
MLNKTRRWCVIPVTREELVDRIVGSTSNPCAGFACEGVLWLNDSLGRDSAQMFAAVRFDPVSNEWRQIDVFSVSWMARDRLKGLLTDLSSVAGWAISAPQTHWVEDLSQCGKCA